MKEKCREGEKEGQVKPPMPTKTNPFKGGWISGVKRSLLRNKCEFHFYPYFKGFEWGYNSNYESLQSPSFHFSFPATKQHERGELLSLFHPLPNPLCFRPYFSSLLANLGLGLKFIRFHWISTLPFFFNFLTKSMQPCFQILLLNLESSKI